MLLNPYAISQSIEVDALRSTNTNDNNPVTLYDSIVGGASRLAIACGISSDVVKGL